MEKLNIFLDAFMSFFYGIAASIKNGFMTFFYNGESLTANAYVFLILIGSLVGVCVFKIITKIILRRNKWKE